MPTPNRIPASQKAGHIVGVVAYGVVRTTVATIGAIAETLFGGLTATGKEVASAWGTLNAPAAPQQSQMPTTAPVAPRPSVPVPPVRKRQPAGQKKVAGGNP